MSSQLSISLNIVIPNDIYSRIIKIQEQLSRSFDELREYDPSGHISVLNKFMEEDEVTLFTEKVNSYFYGMRPFEIRFDSFTKTSSNKYIFLNFDKNSNDVLMHIHQDLIDLTKQIGKETWDGKPATFSFTPHISIIKLNSTVIDEALAIVKAIDFNESFTVTQFEISKEIKDNGEHVGFNKDTVVKLL